MKNPESPQGEQPIKAADKQIGIDPLAVLSLVVKNWYYLVAGIIVALLGARFYIGHTLPMYMSSVKILIHQSDNRTTNANEELLRGLGLPGGMGNLDNQIMILTSRALTEKALKELPFEIEYYHRTIKNRLPVYPEIPVKILSDGSEIPLPRDTEFSIQYLGNNKFQLESESEFYVLSKSASFGQNIEIPGGSFRIECRNEEWMNNNKEQKLFFVIYNPVWLTGNFNSRINVTQPSRTGSVLEVSIQGTNNRKNVDFLNKLAEVFLAVSLDKKNIEAVRRIQFIDDQLIGISDSLSITENKLQQFRSSNRVMDLSAQGQAIIQQVTILENERARLNLESNYYDYLADYLAKDVTGELPIVPITMGITDPGLTRLVTELADLQGQLSARGAGEMNPLQNLLAQRVRSTKDALLETLNGLRRANNLAKNENQEQINRVNSQAAALPVTERQLLGIERKFRLNDEMYTFLLETRAGQQMQKASNTADSEVLDPANEFYSSVISPIPLKIYSLGIFAGTFIPFLLIFLSYLFNKKLKYEDIRKITDLAVVGNIPHSNERSNTIAFDNPNSATVEAFRLLRSKLQFLVKGTKSPVILITSSIPEEGKTFTAINLASVYSLLGKKTILVGFDLRKPKIFQDFNLGNEKGVSTWLIGKDKIEAIIQETSFDNLSVITAGPVPPNPSELVALEKTDELLKLLKETYDYIIIDSSPIGIVSDTYHLASLADACLLIVRPGYTLRDVLGNTLMEMANSNTNGLSLVINDIQSDNKLYSYGEKYGYTYDNERSKKSLFKRR